MLFAADRRAEYGQKPETFEFLGFKHACGRDRSGQFAVIRVPSVKSCRKFLARTRDWLKRCMHWKRRDQQRHLSTMLRGFYQYFALYHCERKLLWVFREVQRHGFNACAVGANVIGCSGATSQAGRGSNCPIPKRCTRWYKRDKRGERGLWEPSAGNPHAGC
jgi:hypothetical protein